MGRHGGESVNHPPYPLQETLNRPRVSLAERFAAPHPKRSRRRTQERNLPQLAIPGLRSMCAGDMASSYGTPQPDILRTARAQEVLPAILGAGANPCLIAQDDQSVPALDAKGRAYAPRTTDLPARSR